MVTGNNPPVPAEPEPTAGHPTGDGRARDSLNRFVRTPANAARDARAAELRAEGWTLQAIADELGYYDKSVARKAIRGALREIVRGPAEKLLTLHVERLETLYEAALEVLEAEHVMVSHGKVVTMADPETGMEKPLTDNGPKLAAIREARATMESFRKLMGLDQPAKVALSGGVRYEVVGVDPADLT
jgi:hypothetical protein